MTSTANALVTGEREISVAWFADLIGILGRYLAVLRYELEQSGGEQTLEALIHAEMTKLLIRQFTAECIKTEYSIGRHFKKGVGKAGKEFARKLRSDIAIFHPVVPAKLKSSLPMVVIELKRAGDDGSLLNDVYRLAVVSLRTKATGYFVFAGPRAHVEKAIKGVKILNQMELSAERGALTDGPHKFNFTRLNKCSLYNAEDHKDAKLFYGQRMFAEENPSEKDPYRIRIFAFHANRDVIAERTDQRFTLNVQRLERSTAQGQNPPLPPVNKKIMSRRK